MITFSLIVLCFVVLSCFAYTMDQTAKLPSERIAEDAETVEFDCSELATVNARKVGA